MSRAVRNGIVNKPPPKQRRPESLPDESLSLLCDLFYSFSALSQHNSENDPTRPQFVCILEQITLSYFDGRGESNLSSKSLFDRIMTENSVRQEVGYKNYREVLRSMWFTVSNMLMHYES